MRSRRFNLLRLVALSGLLLSLSTPFIIAEDSDSEEGIEGAIELFYRAVDVNGEQRKYDEDFDGMTDGIRIGSLQTSWRSEESGWLDHANLSMTGLGGEPYERIDFELGQKDKWSLKLDSWKQDYIYNLFELVPNEDGAAWDAERRFSDLRFAYHPKETIKLVVEYGRGQRSGNSVFMKDLSRDIFRLESPLDQTSERLRIGGDFKLGKATLIVRQELRTLDNDFLNLTEGDLGLDLGNATMVDSYDWDQQDRTSTDWTTLMLQAPLGNRVDLALTVAGTLLGEERLRSEVELEALGIDFSGSEFGGMCAIGGATCSNDATCDAINPGDVCIPNVGISMADQSGDSTFIDLDIGVQISSELTGSVRYQSYQRDLGGTIDRDLDGDGVFEDLDGDATPGSVTSIDYQFDTLTGLLDYRPTRKLNLRAGYRHVDRELDRSGFGTARDADFESDGDGTLLFGVVVKPAKWLKLHADYEDGEIDQAFTSPSVFERQQARLRATIKPNQKTRLQLTFRDWENENISANFRPVPPAIDFNNMIEGNTWAADWMHNANENFSYTLRYANQDVDNSTGINFDTAGFGGTAPGISTFASDNTQMRAQLNYRRGAWRCYLQWTDVDAEGTQDVVDLTAPTMPTLVNRENIDQSYADATIGLDYQFASGLSLGVALRDFDYDDGNNLLDYDGQHLTFRAGLRF